MSDHNSDVCSSSDSESSSDHLSNSRRCVVSSSSDGRVEESKTQNYKKTSCWGVTQPLTALQSFLCGNNFNQRVDPMYLDSFGTDLRHRRTAGRPPKIPYWAPIEKNEDQPLLKITRVYTQDEVEQFLMELEAKRKAAGTKRGRPRKLPHAVVKPALLDDSGRAVKQPRGRPRTKEPKPVVLNELGEVIRKPRGRPRTRFLDPNRVIRPSFY